MCIAMTAEFWEKSRSGGCSCCVNKSQPTTRDPADNPWVKLDSSACPRSRIDVHVALALIRLMLEILHDFIYQNIPKP